MDCIKPGFPVLHHSWNLLKLMSIESVMPPNHLILCHPLLMPSIFPCIRVFFRVSSFHQVAKVLEFRFNISPSSEYSGLIFFRFDVLAVQGTLKSVLQCLSSKASTLQHSAFFMVQLTSIHDYWKKHNFDYTRPLLAK